MDLILIYKICCDVSVAILAGCLVVLSTKRATEAQKFIVYAFMLVLLYLIGCAATFVNSSPDMIFLGQKLKYIGTFCLIVTLFMVFQQVYNVNTTVPMMIGLTLCFAFVNGMIIIGDLNSSWEPTKWFYKDVEVITQADGTSIVKIVPNWGKKVADIAMVVYLFATLMVFFSSLVAAWKRKFQVSALFFISAFIPELLIFLSLFMDVRSLPVVPLGSGVAAILVTIFVCKELFSNLYDQSYKVIMGSLNSPLFVVDNRFFVRRVNYAAKVLFPEYKSLAVNSYHRLAAVKELQDIITPPLHDSGGDDSPFGLLPIGNQFFEPELHRLGIGRHLYGYVIVLNDVTEQYSRGNELSVLASKLSTSLRSNKSRSNEEREKFISGALQFVRDKDVPTAEHMRRMSNYTFIIARELRLMGQFADVLTDSYIETLCQVAPLHDIGKMMLPKDILHKVDLSEEELKLRHSHVNLGSQLVDRMIVNDPKSLYYKLSKEVTLCHHEWWNGRGYPKGLAEDEIPLSARIISVADIIDTLAFRHAERKSYQFDELIEMVVSHSGTRFDPLVVEACVRGKEKLRELYDVLYGKSFGDAH